MRHEFKHQIAPPEDLVLSGRLRRLFPHDPYAGPDGSYRVTSLYFDTPYDAALREKLDGVDRREKFRLRYYGERPAVPGGGGAPAGRRSGLPSETGGASAV